jgi:hypothetical protein
MNGLPLATVSIYWHLPIVIILVSLVYSATRFEKWDAIAVEAMRWGLRMAVFLVGVSVILFVVAQFI